MDFLIHGTEQSYGEKIYENCLWDNLPEEIQLKIVELADMKSLFNFALTCNKNQEIYKKYTNILLSRQIRRLNNYARCQQFNTRTYLYPFDHYPRRAHDFVDKIQLKILRYLAINQKEEAITFNPFDFDITSNEKYRKPLLSLASKWSVKFIKSNLTYYDLNIPSKEEIHILSKRFNINLDITMHVYDELDLLQYTNISSIRLVCCHNFNQKLRQEIQLPRRLHSLTLVNFNLCKETLSKMIFPIYLEKLNFERSKFSYFFNLALFKDCLNHLSLYGSWTNEKLWPLPNFENFNFKSLNLHTFLQHTHFTPTDKLNLENFNELETFVIEYNDLDKINRPERMPMLQIYWIHHSILNFVSFSNFAILRTM